jgi:hypothetical protein
MTNIDQFESVFKAASREPFAWEDVKVRQIAIVTDGDRALGEKVADRVRGMLAGLSTVEGAAWHVLTRDDYESVEQLIRLIGERQIQLVCTYRNLTVRETKFPYTLGTYVDNLTQATALPVLLLPRPDGELDWISKNTDRVMAITDHLTGDHHLVSVAAAFTLDHGTLYLTHVEDQAVYDKYIAVIGKIPALNTDSAATSLRDQLLKEPHDYISSCREKLGAAGKEIQIQEIITMGHRLRDYQRLIKANEIDLLVINTKEDDQLAMHGLAYPLTVELRRVPLLLL